MFNQLFTRKLNDDELKIILNCYNINNLETNNSITYLSLKINNTINKLYENLDILIDVYLPCKYKFISELTIKRCITILRQITRLYDYKVVKYSFNKASIYKIESNNNKNINIKKNVELRFN